MAKIFILGVKVIGSNPIILILFRINIDMMELVNMIDLKSIAFKSLRVRVPLSIKLIILGYYISIYFLNKFVVVDKFNFVIYLFLNNTILCGLTMTHNE